jgi:predicted amidohydrolase YtcJ
MLASRLGKDRSQRAFAFESVSDAARLIFGSAWPTGSLDPLVGLQVATSSPAIDGVDERTAPGESMKLEAAVTAYTSSAAWASFDEQRKGSISPGMLADMVVLSDDIFADPHEKLASAVVAVTIFDGKVVYRRTPRLEETEAEPAPSLQD